MQVIYMGDDFPHDKGEFCSRKVFPYYVVSCFSTPFLYETEGEMAEGNPGDMVIMPPGTVVYHGPQSKEECFYNDWMYVEGEDFEQLLEEYPVPLGTAFSVGSPNFLKNCIHRIREELVLKQTGYEKIISCCITETVVEMHRFFRRQQDFVPAVFRIQAVREMFLKHPEKNWSLQEMAQLVGYSVSRFSALYCQKYGLSPKADLLAIRIELARQLLSYSSLSVTEISERCGFKSIYYFSKYFKKITGLSPSEYTHIVETADINYRNNSE